MALSSANIELYENVTGWTYDAATTTVDQMAERIQPIIDRLEDEADMFILTGVLRDIHVTLDIDLLETFDDVTISAYNDLFYSVEERPDHAVYDRNRLMNEKLKRIELMRYYDYVRSVLFLYEKEEYPLTMHYYTPPTVRDILDNGVDFYFCRIGEATVENLVNRYDTYELIVMLGFLNLIVRKAFILGNSSYGSKDEIAGLVINALDTMTVDPRTYLTHTGPLVLHQDDSYNLWEYSPKKMITKVVQYGIDLFYNGSDAYHKIVLAILDKNFFLSGYEHLEFNEQIVNQTSYIDPNALTMDIKYPLFYGTGNGSDKFQVFDQLELVDLWREKGWFVNPAIDEKFSLRQVKSLLMMDIELQLRTVIIDTLAKVGPTPLLGLNNVISDPASALSYAPKSNLIRLFNAGSVLANIHDTWQPSYHAFDLTSARAFIDPMLRQRVKYNVRNILYALLEMEDLESLWIVDSQEVKNTTDFLWSVKGLLLLMNECTRYKLWDTISYCGGLLLYTSNWYMKTLYGQAIVGTELDFFLSNATLRNNSIQPGDFVADGDND